jgi:hypothetical protein
MISTELTQESRKSGSKETIAATMDQLLQIRKSAPQRTGSDGQAFKSVDMLLSLRRNAFAHSNSNRSPDL